MVDMGLRRKHASNPPVEPRDEVAEAAARLDRLSKDLQTITKAAMEALAPRRPDVGEGPR